MSLSGVYLINTDSLLKPVYVVTAAVAEVKNVTASSALFLLLF